MAYNGGQIQRGSSGSDTKKWQEYLRSQGYDLKIDGIFGTKTDQATREFQSKNGLAVDGIVGEKTWSKALSPSKPSAPTIAPAPTAPTLNYTPWLDTEQGKAAQKAQGDAKDALDEHGKFAWLDQGKLNEYMGQYENRPDFEYDFNADALYQQYKDKYIKQGKMAMQDTIGQASAMTGGYGNSYAQAVGNQAYQASLENLNDVIPELYQMAYDKYNQEGQDLLNKISMMMGERDYAHGLHQEEYSKLADMLNRADSEFYNGANLHQTEQSNANNMAQQNWQNEVSLWDAENQNAWKEAEFNEAVRQYNEQMAFNREQYEDSKVSNIVQNSGGGYKAVVGNDGKLKAEPVEDASDNISSVPQKVIDGVKGYSSEQGQADYLAKMVNDGVIDQNQAQELLAEHGVTDLVNRSWEKVGDGGINWFGIGINANAKVSDGKKTYTLAELRKELEKTMTRKEANKWINDLSDKLGIDY